MLTRLRVSGFKNLVDVDVRFGAFTCIAGANGVGKSNLFDAIAFLSALSEKSLVDAALCVRDEAGKTGDIRSLFHRFGNDYADEMSFEAEMIVPQTGEDDLGQPAKATMTFLRYSLKLRYLANDGKRAIGRLEIIHEELTHITQRDSSKHLLFPHSQSWVRSVISGRRSAPFISTHVDSHGATLIKIHQDGTVGRARQLVATNLPRTVISAANAAETPTATLAQKEMQSWRFLQLEPSSLRSPDPFTAPAKLGVDGAHLAATLYRMAKQGLGASDGSLTSTENPILAQVSNRLARLIEDVREISINRDETRELLTLYVGGRDKTSHPARALSDGTLRFLALAVLELDGDSQGLICLEEPENGIHPRRISAILDLLREVAVDINLPVGKDNPLRQVVINTHSPSVVSLIPDESLLIAEPITVIRGKAQFTALSFACLPKTWRESTEKSRLVSRGRVMEYLNPVFGWDEEDKITSASSNEMAYTKVKDRQDLQLNLLYK